MLNRKMIGMILFFFSGCSQLWGMKKEILIDEDQAHYCSILSLESVGNLDGIRSLIFSVPLKKPELQVVHIKARCTLPEKVFAFDKTGIAIIKARLNSLDIKGNFIFSFREYREVGYYLITKTNFEASLNQHNF